MGISLETGASSGIEVGNAVIYYLKNKGVEYTVNTVNSVIQMKNTKTTKPFYATASKLLKLKINNIEDVKNFYVGVNSLAAEISENRVFLKKLGSLRNDDKPRPITRAVNSILGYGVVEGQSPTLFPQAKRVSLDLFSQWNRVAESEVEVVQKEATVYFNALKKETDSYTKEEVDKIIEGINKNWGDKLETVKKEAVEEAISKMKPPSIDDKIVVGDLVYKNRAISYKDDPIKLQKQSVRICRLLMESHGMFVSDEKIKRAMTDRGRLKKGSIEKAVSLLRCDLLGRGCINVRINRVSGEGYRLEVKNIR